jgi:hypothetical protein
MPRRKRSGAARGKPLRTPKAHVPLNGPANPDCSPSERSPAPGSDDEFTVRPPVKIVPLSKSAPCPFGRRRRPSRRPAPVCVESLIDRLLGDYPKNVPSFASLLAQQVFNSPLVGPPDFDPPAADEPSDAASRSSSRKPRKRRLRSSLDDFSAPAPNRAAVRAMLSGYWSDLNLCLRRFPRTERPRRIFPRRSLRERLRSKAIPATVAMLVVMQFAAAAWLIWFVTSKYAGPRPAQRAPR